MVSATDGLQSAIAAAKTVEDVAGVLREADEFLAAARSELISMLQEEGWEWAEITAVIAATHAVEPSLSRQPPA